MVAYKVKRESAALVTVTVDVESTAGWEQWFLLQSDEHWDNPKSRRDLLRDHLDEAVARDAGIIGGGDFFCAMQGKYDRRSSKDDVRPEHKNGRYLDSLVETAADWYAPWARNVITRSKGNHETAILKNHETDLVERVVALMNQRHGSQVESMGYGYWVRFQFNRGRHQKSFLLKIFHGSGGGGPVTKGVIQTNRRAVFLPDADVVMSGHVHEAWAVCLKRERLTKSNRIVHDSQWHVCCPTYKDEYRAGAGGWHIERGAPPKPLGAFWLRFYFKGGQFRYELIPAVENYAVAG